MFTPAEVFPQRFSPPPSRLSIRRHSALSLLPYSCTFHAVTSSRYGAMVVACRRPGRTRRNASSVVSVFAIAFCKSNGNTPEEFPDLVKWPQISPANRGRWLASWRRHRRVLHDILPQRRSNMPDQNKPLGLEWSRLTSAEINGVSELVLEMKYRGKVFRARAMQWKYPQFRECLEGGQAWFEGNTGIEGDEWVRLPELPATH
jgi:hypothetical protein